MAKAWPVFLCTLFLGVTGHASILGIQWDPNTEEDLRGYRVFMSTVPLMEISTVAAMGMFNVQKSTVGKVATADILLPSGTTHYLRLTAFDTENNQSAFNVGAAGQPHQLGVFIKPGDVNKDNVVGIVDLSILLRDFGTTAPQADINNSGRVDIADLSQLLTNWGT